MGGLFESLPCRAFIETPLFEDPYPFVNVVRNSIEKRNGIRIPTSRALEVYFEVESIAPKQFLKALAINRLNKVAERFGENIASISDQVPLETPETHHLLMGEPVQIPQ